MPKIFSILLAAKIPEDQDIPAEKERIRDFENDTGRLLLEQFAIHRMVLFPPQIIIVKDINEADEKTRDLFMGFCSPTDGWAYQQGTYCDISKKWEKHIRGNHFNDGYLKFFIISVMGLGYDSKNPANYCLASGALSAGNEQDAYSRFKEKVTKKLLRGRRWMAGIAQVRHVTLENFPELRDFSNEQGIYRSYPGAFHTTQRH
ncbi:MAG: hypothetical protein Q7S04_00340 [Candidatus Moranbacteria bacterium]|nr:hypothetical protein [Candidatus Moranbacteria bacterium]